MPWPPQEGDKIEMFSRYSHTWFPAVVMRSKPFLGGGWPSMTVKLLSNVSDEDDVQESELRPLDWLAAAKRDPVRFAEPYPAWGAYDEDAAEHMDSCPGCPECDGLDEYYPACPHCGDRRHRDQTTDCACHKYPWFRDQDDSKACMAMAWRRAGRTRRSMSHLKFPKICAETGRAGVRGSRRGTR